MFDKNFSAMKIMNGDNTQYFINGKETTKEDYEKCCSEYDNTTKVYSHFPYHYSFDVKEFTERITKELQNKGITTKSNKQENINNTLIKTKNTEKEKAIDFDKLYNSYEIIDFLSKNDGFYAHCVNNGFDYIYDESGLHEMDKERPEMRYAKLRTLPMNSATLNYKFKIMQILKVEKWIDCSINVAMRKLNNYCTIRSIDKDGKEKQRYTRTEEKTGVIVQDYTESDIVRDIRDNCTWQYMEQLK
jgi:hypothetical protein